MAVVDMPASAIHAVDASVHRILAVGRGAYVWVHEWPADTAALELALHTRDGCAALEPWGCALLLDIGDALYMRAPEDFVVLLSCDTAYAVDDDATHRLVF